MWFSVGDLANSLQELKASNDEVTAIPKAGIVMVRDMSSNVENMVLLAVEQPEEQFYMVRDSM